MTDSQTTEIKRALCFGCWLQAGVLATVADGKVVQLKGEPGHPVNQGWICERSKAFIEHLYHEDRLNFPLKRIGERGEGKWQKISWDDAMNEVAEKLDRIKSQAPARSAASTARQVPEAAFTRSPSPARAGPLLVACRATRCPPRSALPPGLEAGRDDGLHARARSRRRRDSVSSWSQPRPDA